MVPKAELPHGVARVLAIRPSTPQSGGRLQAGAPRVGLSNERAALELGRAPARRHLVVRASGFLPCLRGRIFHTTVIALDSDFIRAPMVSMTTLALVSIAFCVVATVLVRVRRATARVDLTSITVSLSG